MFCGRLWIKISSNLGKWLLTTTTLSLLILLNPFFGYAKETTTRKLPTPPKTGTPQDEFQSGGTRDNLLQTKLCDRDSGQIVYLLGDNNIEYTSSEHPVFWFYFPDVTEIVARGEFVLEESNTGKTIYHRTIEVPKRAGIVGIALPKEEKYVLSPNVDYGWRLDLNCVGLADRSMTMQGWLHRLPLNVRLQNQIATISAEHKYRVYLQNNLLYDALNHLAQRRTREPRNLKIETAWNRLLAELGWHNLIQQSAIEPYVLKSNRFHLEKQ